MRVPTIGSSPSNEVHHRCRCRCRWWVCLSVVVVVPLSGRLGWWGKRERETDEKKKKCVDVCVGPCVSPSCCARYASQNAASSSRSVDCQVRKVFAAPLPASRVPPPFHRIRARNFQIRPRADTRLRILYTDKLSQHGAGTPHNTRTPHNITYPPLGHNLVVK